ncbi:hypothetical protein QCA50_018452 [Cerrena zonata]|uniref:Uncharacterized protein n=1 Tax=Cerrena zonata TaxID=2478898 RepID=A0AAW0FPF7_9APHY
MNHLVLTTVFDASTLPAMDYSSLFSSGLRAMSLRKPRPSSVIIESSPTKSSRPESAIFSPNHKRSESEKAALHKRQTIHGSYGRSYRERDTLSRAPTLPSRSPVPSQRNSVISRPLPPVPPNTAALQDEDVFMNLKPSRDSRSLRISPTPSMVHLPTPTAHRFTSGSPDANADDSFLSFTASPIESPVYTYSETGRRPVTVAIDVRSSTRKHTISSSSSEVERDLALEKLEKSRRRRSAKEPIVLGHDYHAENDMDWRYVVETFLEEEDL